jgi:5-methylcytosine-specific restriction endonuclease McrBC GTP-binding regulatory subunit McrB
LNSFETQLKAAAFAILESEESEATSRNYEIVAVGADWTTNESVVGYADALHVDRFVRTQVLDLLLRASESPNRPYFLVLDEMNLSHVERYFVDFLSAMETGEPIVLHTGTEAIDGVPPRISIPLNLFVIGTVNVDETTYMFSPKVLDRANTIEFRVERRHLAPALLNPAKINLGAIRGRGAHRLDDFVRYANQPLAIPNSHRAVLATEAMLLFEILEEHGHEFAFRVAYEIARFFGALHVLMEDFDASYGIDAQIYQKILPRLSGSRAQLEPVLLALASFCLTERQWDDPDGTEPVLRNGLRIVEAARRAANDFDESVFDADGQSIFPLSFAKLQRMHKRLQRNGFTSFAEA